MFVRNGAVTPGLSRECNVTFFSEGFKWGIGSVGRWICKFGAPIFAPNFRENACFKGVWGKFEVTVGRPKFESWWTCRFFLFFSARGGGRGVQGTRSGGGGGDRFFY